MLPRVIGWFAAVVGVLLVLFNGGQIYVLLSGRLEPEQLPLWLVVAMRAVALGFGVVLAWFAFRFVRVHAPRRKGDK